MPFWTPFPYSNCLTMGGAWLTTVHGVAKSRTGLSDFTVTNNGKGLGGVLNFWNGERTPWAETNSDDCHHVIVFTSLLSLDYMQNT